MPTTDNKNNLSTLRSIRVPLPQTAPCIMVDHEQEDVVCIKNHSTQSDWKLLFFFVGQQFVENQLKPASKMIIISYIGLPSTSSIHSALEINLPATFLK